MIHMEKRLNPSALLTTITPVLAVLLTMVMGGAMFAILGKPPLEAIRIIFWDPLFDPTFASYSRPQLLVKAGPLILIAIGLSFGFRAGIWNIGAEGQYIIGAICGAAVGLALYPLESRLIFPLMVLAGALGGWIWAMISFLASVSQGLLKNPEGMGFPGSRNLRQYDSTHNAELISGSGMHWGVVVAFISVIFAYILLTQHLRGFQIRLTGEAPKAAEFAGIKPSRLVLFCLGFSGILAGMAGLFEVSGPAGQITTDFNSGYGFTAIIVAFLGRLNPWGILAAGLLMALTYIGGELAQLMLGVPGASIQLFQGMLLFFLLATDLFINYRIRFGRGK